MKKLLYLCISTWLIWILNSCAFSAISQIYIPQNKGELDLSASLGIGVSGIHANGIYALTNRLCLQGAAQFSPFTFHTEVGLGLKTTGGAQLISITYGKAKYYYGVLGRF